MLPCASSIPGPSSSCWLGAQKSPWELSPWLSSTSISRSCSFYLPGHCFEHLHNLSQLQMGRRRLCCSGNSDTQQCHSTEGSQAQTTAQGWPRTHKDNLLKPVMGKRWSLRLEWGIKRDKTLGFEIHGLHPTQKSGLLAGKTVQQRLHGGEEEKPER